MNVLIADDLGLTRKILKNYVLSMGFDEALLAEDGLEALKIAKERKGDIDLVLCDIVMPNMDGFQFLDKFRAMEEYKDTPVIMISGMSEKEDIVKAKKYGIKHFIVKPISQNALEEKIKNSLKDKEDYIIK